MHCPRCQHENRPQAKFCDKCASPVGEASASTRSDADTKGEVESLRHALTEAVDQQKATAELLQTRDRELADAQEQQTATSEILRVIATSPTDVQPVFAAVLMSAARLCDALDAAIFQVDGDGLRLVAHEGPILSHPVGEFPLIRGTTVGRAVLDRRTIHVPDLQAEVDEYPDSSFFARSFGVRTTLSVPLLRGAEAIGAIAIRRTEVRPFTDRQIELLQTFAAQAVIAIENVRLFNETKECDSSSRPPRARSCGSSRARRPICSRSWRPSPRTPPGCAGRRIRRSSASKGSTCAWWRGAGRYADHWRSEKPYPSVATPSADGLCATAGRSMSRTSWRAEAEFPVSVSRMRQAGSDIRTMLATPLLREGTPLGVIFINRGPEVHPFSAKQIALLETFANQAVIAIENVRLFKELRGADGRADALGGRSSRRWARSAARSARRWTRDGADTIVVARQSARRRGRLLHLRVRRGVRAVSPPRATRYNLRRRPSWRPCRAVADPEGRRAAWDGPR